MKSGTLDLMKFKRLKRRLGETDRGTAGLLTCLWQRAAKDCPRGDIGKFSNEEIAVMADYQGDADNLIETLADVGWLDRHDEHRLVIHDWHEHAPNWLRGVAAKRGGFVTIDNDQASTTIDTEPSKSSQVLPSHPPPPTPAPLNPTAPEPEPLPDDWGAVVVEMAKEGVRKAEHACEAARQNGALAFEAIRVIDYWRQQRPAWDAGALYYRVLGLRANDNPTKRWPSPSKDWEKLQSRNSVVQQSKIRSKEKCEVLVQKEMERLEAECREQEFGAKLNAMSRKEVRSMISETYGEKASFYFDMLPKKGPPTGLLREALLRQLSPTALNPGAPP